MIWHMPLARKLAPQDFLTQLNHQNVPSIILLLGEETYFCDRIISALRANVFGGVKAEFSTFTFFMMESHLEEAVVAATTNSLLAPKKLVIIRDLDRLRENQIKERDEQELVRYLENPNPQTVLVVQAEKLDGRRRITQILQKHACVVDCSAMALGATIQWVDRHVGEAGFSIDAFAAKELVEAVGNSLTLLDQEIQKLINFAGSRRRITTEDVDVLMFRARVNNVFDLVDAINQRDRLAAVRILQNLFENDFEWPILLFWMERLYRQLLTIKDQPRKLDGWGVVRLLHVPRDYADRLLRQERAFSRDELVQGFHRFASFDRSLKSSSVNPHLQFEFFIFELMRGAAFIHV
jgi:DNA polymerase-3 subunit delta